VLRNVLFRHLPPWEQRRSKMPFARARVFLRVFAVDFAVRTITVRAIARRPATTFGAGALFQDGRKNSREAQTANRRHASDSEPRFSRHLAPCPPAP
jgi:hypothetical protein